MPASNARKLGGANETKFIRLECKSARKAGEYLMLACPSQENYKERLSGWMSYKIHASRALKCDLDRGA
jgi:hypothetical protein